MKLWSPLLLYSINILYSLDYILCIFGQRCFCKSGNGAVPRCRPGNMWSLVPPPLSLAGEPALLLPPGLPQHQAHHHQTAHQHPAPAFSHLDILVSPYSCIWCCLIYWSISSSISSSCIISISCSSFCSFFCSLSCGISCAISCSFSCSISCSISCCISCSLSPAVSLTVLRKTKHMGQEQQQPGCIYTTTGSSSGDPKIQGQSLRSDWTWERKVDIYTLVRADHWHGCQQYVNNRSMDGFGTTGT